MSAPARVDALVLVPTTQRFCACWVSTDERERGRVVSWYASTMM